MPKNQRTSNGRSNNRSNGMAHERSTTKTQRSGFQGFTFPTFGFGKRNPKPEDKQPETQNTQANVSGAVATVATQNTKLEKSEPAKNNEEPPNPKPEKSNNKTPKSKTQDRETFQRSVQPQPKTQDPREAAMKAAQPYRRLASIFPENIVLSFRNRLRVAGVKEDTRIWLGRQLLFGVLTGLIFLLIYDIYLADLNRKMVTPDLIETILPTAFLLMLAGLIPTMIVIYFRLYFRVADRTTQVEKILPDFLSLTVSNLRAGMTPFAAFLHAARPEFGDFSAEVKTAASRASGSQTLVNTLEEINQNFASPILHRIVNLFAKGIKSGAQLSKLLNASAEEIRHIQDLRAELAATTRTYTVFLGFIIIVVLPFLLSVSNQFISVFISMNIETSSVDSSSLQNVPTFSGKIGITADEMFNISIGMLVLTSALVSTLTGLISRGKALYGLKYFPIFALASVGMFFITRSLIGSIFSAFSA